MCNPVLHKYTCGDRKFEYYEASVIARPYPIKETTGEHDCHTCKGCQNNRNQIVESLKVREGKFPLCCEYHKRLLSFKSFDATQYKGAANLCADKVIFTYQHILNNQNNDSWQIDIKQYLNYAIDSFGCFPEGYGEPLFLSDYIKYVTALINGNTDIKQEVRKYVYSYFEQLRKPRVKGDPIKLLLDTYNRWLNLFPFNISIFRDLRCDYANRTPLIITGKESNIYSTEVSFNLITPDELIEFLRSITSRLFEVVSSKIAVGTEHYTFAHPNRNTQRTDENYQMVCLISKLDSIERNFQAGRNDYSLADFTRVLNEGLETDEFSEQMGYEMIKAHLLKYLRPA